MKNYKGDEIKRSWKTAGVGVALVAGAVLLAGCSNQTVRDLEGVPVTDPDKVELVVSVDQFPNVVLMCKHGVAFALTTREAAGAVMRVPELDGTWCAE